jgi:tetratricopeptide (TPR) repeat protein
MITKFSVPVLAVLLSAAVFAPAASADPPTSACRAAPTRACVFETAIAVAASLKEPAARANLIAQIAAMQQQAGLADAASAAFARAVEEAKTVSGAKSDLPLIGLAAARAEMGDATAALDNAHAGKASGARAFALTGVAAALERLGRVDEAAPIFNEALEAARAASSYERPFALIHLALAQAKAGLDSASATFDLAFEAAKQSKFEVNLVAVATQRIRAGEFIQAFTEIGELPEPLRSNPLQTLAEVEATSGRIDDAAQVARSISDNAGRAAALATVAVAAARAKRAMDVEELIVDAHSAAEAETIPYAKATALAHVAGAEAVSGPAPPKPTSILRAR